LASSTCRLLLLVPCLAYSSTLKVEGICFAKILSSLQITQHCKPEDHTLHSHCHENSKYNLYFTLVLPFVFAPVDMRTLLTFGDTHCLHHQGQREKEGVTKKNDLARIFETPATLLMSMCSEDPTAKSTSMADDDESLKSVICISNMQTLLYIHF
jgi:hypothetical protein